MNTSNTSPHHPLRQIQGLQVLRALAVLLVTAGHVNQITVPTQIVSAFDVHFGNLSMFGVDVFFVISGFILGSTAMRAASGKPRIAAYDFIARRILRIFPVYWIVILFPLSRLLRQGRLTGFAFLDYWLLLPGLSSETKLIIGLAWTLVFEMVFYYVIALFMRFTLRRAVPNTIAALTLLVLVGTFLDIRRPVLIILMNPIILEFVLGGVTAVVFHKLHKRRALGLITLAVGIIATGALTILVDHNLAVEQNVLSNHGVMFRVATWGVTAWMLVSGVVFWGPEITSTLGKFFVAIGNGSYSIYLTSAISIEMIARLIAKVPTRLLTDQSVLPRDSIALAGVVLVGMTFYWTIEKPLGKWLGALYSSNFKRKEAHPVPQSVGA